MKLIFTTLIALCLALPASAINLSGTYTIGATGNYVNITAAITAIESISNTVTGHCYFELQSDYSSAAETGNSFTGYNTNGAWTITFRPALGVTAVTAWDAGTGSIFQMSGADNVIFDGRPGGVGTVIGWTVRTNSASANPGSIFRFNADSRNVTMKYLQIESHNATNLTGMVEISTSSALGNDNITISNCILRDRSDISSTAPTCGVIAFANAIYPNDSTTITNNQFFNIATNGIQFIGGNLGNGFLVQGNHFYKPAGGSAPATAIRFEPSGGVGHRVINNYIGGTAPFAGGVQMTTSTAELSKGIIVSVSNTDSSWIKDNIVQNIAFTAGLFAGIEVIKGRVSICGNTIGSSTSLTGINSAGVNAQYGISFTQNFGSVLEANVFSNLIANISQTATGNTFPSGVRGINWANITPASQANIHDNVIRNLSSSCASPVTFYAASAGIHLTAAGDSQIIANNVIHDLSSVGGGTGNTATLSAGIVLNDPAGAGTIRNNHIYNIYNSAKPSPNAQVIGVYLRDGAAWNLLNNMISLGTGVNDTTITISGILDSTAGINNIRYNSIRIAGNNLSGTDNSQAVRRIRTSTMNLRNNIFVNLRTGTGSHYTVVIPDTPGFSANHNNYYAANTVTAVSFNNVNYNLAAWKAASFRDTTTTAVPVTFTSANDLHLAGGSIGDNNLSGAPDTLTNIDYDYQARSIVPYKGADEIVTWPLYVSLLDIAATATGSNALVAWTTATEQGLSQFVVEGSVDGRSFISLGTVKAAGNTSGNYQYQFLHRNAAEFAVNNKVYYRLRMLNLDNSASYSPTVSARFDRETADVTVMPNPFTDVFTLIVSSPSATPYQYMIYDMTGKLMASGIAAGNGTTTIDALKGKSSGLYYLLLKGENDVRSVKMMKK